MFTISLILLGKLISYVSKLTNHGAGSTWPGHIALSIQPNFVRNILKNSPTKVILVVGTNGKTTTSRMLATILKENLPAGRQVGNTVMQNESGANLLNGIASTLLLNTNARGKVTVDFAIFEVDENNLPLVLKQITPTTIIALDLFRDQLDRYGELDSIAKKWQHAFSVIAREQSQVPSGTWQSDRDNLTTKLILNADDPLMAYLGIMLKNAHVFYFGLNDKNKTTLEHAADSIYCPRCNHPLSYTSISYSHLGIWHCPHCKLQRPRPNISESMYPLPGTYNKYNTLAAVLAALQLGVENNIIQHALQKVTPAFGRQEKLKINNKHVQIFLAKNPTGFNENLRTIAELGAKNVLFVLNDRIPDGRDISWIWDMDIEQFISKFKKITVSGDRSYDMALRMQYAQNLQDTTNKKQTNNNFQIYEKLEDGIRECLKELPDNETLYILPTYTAMLEVRKILTGRKIL